MLLLLPIQNVFQHFEYIFTYECNQTKTSKKCLSTYDLLSTDSRVVSLHMSF